MPMIKLDGNLKLFYCPYLVRKYATLHAKQYELSSIEHSYFGALLISLNFHMIFIKVSIIYIGIDIELCHKNLVTTQDYELF